MAFKEITIALILVLETIPVYRMLNTQSGAHLFSSDRNEINYLETNQPHFTMENNGEAVFYVFEL